MNKLIILALACCCYVLSLYAQVQYKQNFLLAFSKQPTINNCEAVYSFLCCSDNSCTDFTSAKTSLAKAYEELTELQLATNKAAMPSSYAPMNAEEGKALKQKLKNMSKEEKMQWAMQNAQNSISSAGTRINKDINNQQVNEAVKCVIDQQEKDLKNQTIWIDFSSQFSTIEKKYTLKKEDALKKFQQASGTTYDPSSSSPYVQGDASDAQIAKVEKAASEYKKTVMPLYTSEMDEKLKYILQTEKNLLSTYTFVEEKIASTHYADDAQEPSNKLHLIQAHLNVLLKVRTAIDIFAQVLSDYADRYAALMKIKTVREMNKK